jgi:hypothetical protein
MSLFQGAVNLWTRIVRARFSLRTLAAASTVLVWIKGFAPDSLCLAENLCCTQGNAI